MLPKARLGTLIPSNRTLATSREFLDANPWAKPAVEQVVPRVEQVVPRVKPDHVFASAGLLNAQLRLALTRVSRGKAGAKPALDEVVRVVQHDLEEKRRK